MPETLEIQIVDKPSGGGSSAPPRAPAADNPPMPARPPGTMPPSSDSTTPPARNPKAEGDQSIVETILDELGYGVQFRAFKQLFDYFAGVKPQAKENKAAARKAPSAALPAPPPFVLPAQPPAVAGPASAAKAPLALPPPRPQPAPSDTSAAIAALRTSNEGGFHNVVAAIRNSAAAPAPAAPAPIAEKSAAAPALAVPPSHAPASVDLRPNPDLDKVFGATKPQPPQAPATATPVPSAAQTMPKPPLEATPKPPAAAPAVGAQAAEGGAMAAGAEVAGGALAGVAAAAFPIAAAFIAVEGAIELTKSAFNTAREATELLGHQLADLAQNNYLGMFNRGLDTAQKGLEKIPIVGGLLSSAFGALIAPVKAFEEVTSAFTARAHELAGLNPALAMAEQRQEIRSLFDDFREANALGPDMARMLDAETNLQHDMRELFLPIKKVVMGVLADVMEKAQEWMPVVRDALVALLEAAKMIIQLLDKMTLGVLKIGGVIGLIEDIQKGIRNIDFNTKKEPDMMRDPFLDDLLGMNANIANAADPWRGIEGDARPNIPIVQVFAGS